MRWIFSEAIRNVLSGTTHALRHSAVLAAVIGVCLVADLLAVDSILTRAAEYRDSGGAVTTIEAAGLIDAEACDALAEAPGVVAAGAIKQQEKGISASVLPRGPIASYTVSPGLLGVLNLSVDSGQAGVIISDEVAKTLGLSVGDQLETTTGSTAVRAIFPWPQDGRKSGYSYAALTPTLDRQGYDECWVRAWPVPTNLIQIMQTTVQHVAAENSQIIISQLNTSLGVSFDGTRLFDERPTQWAPYVAILAGLILGFSAVRARRLELAAARHIGVSGYQQHSQMLVEALCWIATASILVALASYVVVSQSSGEDNQMLIRLAVLSWLPGVVAAVIGTQLATLITREEQLFSYFKSR